MKKNRLFFLRATAILVLALVALLDIAFLLHRDRAVSPLENRNLQQRPTLTVPDLLSGRFETRFDSYISDQFPLREGWIALKSTMDRLAGRTESNNVFLGKDGYLIQGFRAPDAVDYRRTMEALTDFLDRHEDLPQYVMIAPTAVTVLADRLPALADAGDEGGYIDRLEEDLSETPATFIDLRPAFDRARGDTRLYYYTDHHWTGDGARLAYLELAKAAGLPADTDSFERRLLSNRFQGTLSAASGFRMNQSEDLWAYIPGDGAPHTVVTWVNENRRSASLFRDEYLDTRDQYAVFLGGNFPEVRIETTVANGRTLLVLKDSYANCMLPLLAQGFQKIVVVDPRYFTGDLEVLMEAEGANEVLILYNAETLAEDTALRGDIGKRGGQP
jgi:hypothetical protein